MKLKTITITINKGVVEVKKQDKGTRLIVKDFDVQEETGFEERGKPYEKSTYEVI